MRRVTENCTLLIENDYHYAGYQLPNIVCVFEIYIVSVIGSQTHFKGSIKRDYIKGNDCIG